MRRPENGFRELLSLRHAGSPVCYLVDAVELPDHSLPEEFRSAGVCRMAGVAVSALHGGGGGIVPQDPQWKLTDRTVGGKAP